MIAARSRAIPVALALLVLMAACAVALAHGNGRGGDACQEGLKAAASATDVLADHLSYLAPTTGALTRPDHPAVTSMARPSAGWSPGCSARRQIPRAPPIV